ncbi:MAG: tetratricopeptide repeat protein, partial [Draconibacterium sp.]|nr:tetratricopeptide repeat protein [Draconibacterium sp.]
VLLGILIFLFIGYGFYQAPRQSRKSEAERIKRIAENNPEAAEKLRRWNEGEIELTQAEVEELLKIFDVLGPDSELVGQYRRKLARLLY